MDKLLSSASQPSQEVPRNEADNVQTRTGYSFDKQAPVWKLDKNTSVNVGSVSSLLETQTRTGYLDALAHFARTFSSGYVNVINSSMLRLIRNTESPIISTSMLINYRSTLPREQENFVGRLRSFLLTWHELQIPGVDSDVTDLLKSWRIRGSIRGDAVKRLDPTHGPLTDNELIAFNEGAARAYEMGSISIADLSIALLISHTGRRAIQISHTKIGDLDDTKRNLKGERLNLIHIPRAKQRSMRFRESTKAYAANGELWLVLQAQKVSCIAAVEKILNQVLSDSDRNLLPLFPDVAAFSHVQSLESLRNLLTSDRLHIQTREVGEALRRVTVFSDCRSERVGGVLCVSPRRFRYTTGTRAAREGLGIMVIAELLDHSDTQNADIYVKNVPEHAGAIDQAMGHQLVRYAQAFQGTLVDHESDAKRGADPTSRIRHSGLPTGTCGSYGFCGANVPIPCYTCMHFQPWVNGPHEAVYQKLLSERERIFEITGDAAVAAVNDRTIIAVAQVIQMCRTRLVELRAKIGEA